MTQRILLEQKQQKHRQHTVSQILRTYGKQFRQIQLRYSDENNGRCVIGVLMSYFGWNGKVNFDTANDILTISEVLEQANIDYDLLIGLNDSGYSFDEIADYLERNNEIGFEFIEPNSEDSIHYYL